MSWSSHISPSKKSKKQVELFGPRRYPQRWGKEEFGLGKKEYAVCKDCGIAYYDKSWHESLADYKHLKEKNIDKKLIKFVLCPACEMKKNKQYEGLVTIYNVPEKIKEELVNLAKNMGETARRIDPIDRILKIKETKKYIEIWTTENQLAKKIANKIVATFPNQLGKKKLHLSGEESDVINITIGE